MKDNLSVKEEIKIYAADICWDIDEEEIANNIIKAALVEKALGRSEAEIIASARKYDKVSSKENIVFDNICDAIRHNAYNHDIDDNINIPPNKIEIPLEFWANGCDAEDISNYISNETGYCHRGFVIECNYSTHDLYAMIEKIDKELKEEYKDGETNWAANLEVIREEIETAICLMEEEIERNHDEYSLER